MGVIPGIGNVVGDEVGSVVGDEVGSEVGRGCHPWDWQCGRQ